MLRHAQLQAATAQSSLQGALQRLDSLKQQLQNSSSLVENTHNTVKEANKLVTHTHAAGRSAVSVPKDPKTGSLLTSPVPQPSANEAQHRLEEVEHRAARLMERITPLSMLEETLRRNLSDIRQLINQARRQAALVHKHTQQHKRLHTYTSSQLPTLTTLSLTNSISECWEG